MNRTALADSLLVARLYLLRGWRRAIANPRTLALKAGVLVALWLFVVTGDARTLPSEVEPERFKEMMRGAAAGLWLAFVAVAALSTPTAARSVQGSSFLLRSAGLRPTLWGTMLGKYARRVAIFGAFVVATAFVLAWGFDVPTRNPLTFVALLVFFLTAELTGMAVRLGVAATGVQLGDTGRVLFGGVGVIVLSVGVGYPEESIALLSHLPVAAFGEAFIMGIPEVAADETLVVWATAGGVVGSLVLAVVIEQFALRSWFTGGSRERAGAERTRVDDLLGRLGITGPTRAVAWRLWLQSRRRPLVLGLLAVPALVVGLALVEPGGTDIPLFPLSIGLYAVWMATVSVGLNPLSSEDETLTHLLSAPGRDIVRGYALTTVCLGIPVTVAAVSLAGVLVGPLWLTVPALLVSVAVLLGVVPGAIAIGLIMPRVGALEQSVDGPITPSKFAIGVHSVLLGLLVAPATLVITFAGRVPPVAVYAGSGVTILAALLTGTVALNLAANRLDGMTLG
ncbi:MAG: hypothetical protein J07HX64_01841 [halophilic archaeon J07HX64]|jgi:hypothetical protein|nr:MAG: hypothetical protein J07HX64_01841 [halophilic archaeon J07HX64]